MEESDRVLTRAQESLLKDVVGRIIPGEGEFPSAGDLGVAAYTCEIVGPSPGLTALFPEGLAHIEAVARGTENAGFASISDEAKDRVLKRVEQERPEFFSELIRQTYNGYYTNPAIFPLLGYVGDPPRPPTYDAAPLDPRLLDRVRERGPIYRDV